MKTVLIIQNFKKCYQYTFIFKKLDALHIEELKTLWYQYLLELLPLGNINKILMKQKISFSSNYNVHFLCNKRYKC